VAAYDSSSDSNHGEDGKEDLVGTSIKKEEDEDDPPMPKLSPMIGDYLRVKVKTEPGAPPEVAKMATLPDTSSSSESEEESFIDTERTIQKEK